MMPVLARFVLLLLVSKLWLLSLSDPRPLPTTGPPTVARTAQESTTSTSCAAPTTAPSTSRTSGRSSASSGTPTSSFRAPSTTGCRTSILTVSQAGDAPARGGAGASRDVTFDHIAFIGLFSLLSTSSPNRPNTREMHTRAAFLFTRRCFSLALSVELVEMKQDDK